MELPKEIGKMNLKQVRCKDCISFDRKTKVYCFFTKGSCKPKQKACKNIRYRKEEP